MPTTQRLDEEDKDNQRTQQLLAITTQEKRDSTCFRIIVLRMFNQPLSAYNIKVR